MRIRVLPFTLMLLVVAVASQAQLHRTWGPTGPTNNSAALITFGDTAFLDASGYCMRSEDGGANWTILSNGPGSVPFRPQATCFGRLGDRIYMGTINANVIYTSDDFGDHWSLYAGNIPALGIVTNAVTSDGRVFMAGNGFLPLCYTNALDTGWTPTSLTGIVTALSVIGHDSLWATMGGKTFYSHDNGDTWTQIGKEPLTGFGLGSTDFVKAGNRILALTNGGGPNTTYYSDDYGNSWKLADQGFSIGRMFYKVSDDEIYALGFQKVVGVEAYSAIYLTTDRGVTYTPMTPLPTEFSMAPLTHAQMLVTGPGGLYKMPRNGQPSLIPFSFTTSKNITSTDQYLFSLTDFGLSRRAYAGGTWDPTPAAMTTYMQHTANNIESYNGALYLSTDSGVWRSTDDAGSFASISSTLLGKNIVAYYESGSTSLAAQTTVTNTFGILTRITDTVYYSVDGGSSWHASALATTSTPKFQATGLIIFAGKWYVFGNIGYAMSADQGQSWTFTNTTGFGYNLGTHLYLFDGKLEREIYDADHSGGTTAIEQSSDGLTFVVDTVGLGNRILSWPNAFGVFASGGKLYAYYTLAGAEGIYSKSTAGADWTPVPNTSKLVNYPTQLVEHEGDLYVSIYSNGVWSTSTGGSSRVADNDRPAVDAMVYPNPAAKTLSITTDLSGNVTATFYDALGREVLQADAGNGPIDIGGLSAGTYNIRLSNGHETRWSRGVVGNFEF